MAAREKWSQRRGIPVRIIALSQSRAADGPCEETSENGGRVDPIIKGSIVVIDLIEIVTHFYCHVIRPRSNVTHSTNSVRGDA